MKFVTTITDIHCMYLNEYLGLKNKAVICEGSVRVTWNAEPDIRPSYIKCIDVSIEKITVNIQWQIHLQDVSEEETKALRVKFNGTVSSDFIEGTIEILPAHGWESILNAKFSPYGQFRPEEAEINFKTKKITIE